MRTLDLNEAAAFLHMSAAVLRQKAKLGHVRAAKPGKRWVFLELDLVDYLRSLYPGPGQVPLSGCDQEKSLCHSVNAATSGGYVSRHPMVSEYSALLGLPTRKVKLR